MKQAFLNLFINAIEAIQKEGTITVKTRADFSCFTRVLEDTGGGIDPKDLSHIFDAFFTKKEKGTSLGLSVTQGIVEEHKGKIHAESKKGEGTAFIMELPLGLN